jgi:hypothetical protein
MGITRHIDSETASAVRSARRCPHTPVCPAAGEPTRLAAVIVGGDGDRDGAAVQRPHRVRRKPVALRAQQLGHGSAERGLTSGKQG